MSIQQLLPTLLIIYNNYRSHCYTDIIYLDFRKAFDSVLHGQLLVKLWKSGVTGSAWCLIKDYLFNRFQCISIDSVLLAFASYFWCSSWQHSVWGLYFFFYLSMIFPLLQNPFPYFFLLMIACVWAQSNPYLIRHYFRRTWIISCSGHMNGFFYSTSPSVNLLGSLTRFPGHQVPIGSYNTEQTSQQRDLGVNFCDDLSWSQHYNRVISKVYSILFFLRRTISLFHSVGTKHTPLCFSYSFTSHILFPCLEA